MSKIDVPPCCPICGVKIDRIETDLSRYSERKRQFRQAEYLILLPCKHEFVEFSISNGILKWKRRLITISLPFYGYSYPCVGHKAGKHGYKRKRNVL